MRFIPVLHPFFPISGILILHSVIVFSLSQDRKRCSKAYINGPCMMELTLLSVTMASAASGAGMITFWDMLLNVTRCTLCPCWLWMALETSGVKPAGLEPGKAYFVAMLPVLVFSAILFTNPLHGWHWPRTWFEGRVLVVERGLLPTLNTVYSQILLVASSILYLVGVLRHHGNERLRLIVLAVAYGFLFIGDWAWRLGLPLFRGVNPLSFFMTISFYAVGVSVLLYGFPRVRAPITEEDIRTMPPLELPRSEPAAIAEKMPQAGSRHAASSLAFSAERELSERQLSILHMVMEGQPYKAIALALGITERTVKYHMGQILDKYGLETREQLIAWAALQGLAPPAMAAWAVNGRR